MEEDAVLPMLGAVPAPAAATPMAARSLESLMDNLGESFTTRLLRLIDERGLKDSTVYKQSNISRQHFSKIRSNTNYNPNKKTVLAFAVGLHLSEDETIDLLKSAGYAFSDGSKRDWIVRYCFQNTLTPAPKCAILFSRLYMTNQQGAEFMTDAFYGILIPFLGTSLGAASVFFLKQSLGDHIQRALTGFAAGVMVAASIWSLLIPAMDQSAALGKLAFFPAAVGFWLGILFLLLLDHIIPHLHRNSEQAEGPHSQLQRTTMMVLAVTLHNIPEGMAVGVVYAEYLSGTVQITAVGALALSLGIAIQNFPEGAIISMPLRAEGMSKGRAFWGGVLSGIVEPIGAVLTILAASIIVPALPYLLSFAAGAMLYVVVEELIPEMSQGEHSDIGTVFFAVGFSLMMVLDVALG